MPEVTAEQAEWVVEHLRSRGIVVLLNTSLASAVDGFMELISMPGKTPTHCLAADTLLWTAGVQPAPASRHFGFPLDARGRITADATLRILDADGNPIEGAWTAGDVAAVPDLTGGGVGGYCVPNAQHAVRQAKHLASNLYTTRFGDGRIKEYKHHNLGAVAGFGMHKGVGKILGIKLKGAPAWLIHRGLETLEVRFARMCASALAVAELAAGHPAVRAVAYPGLPDHPDAAIVARQMTAAGGVVGLEFADAAAAERFIGAAAYVVAQTSFGGTHTAAERRARWGDDVPAGFVRLSVGVEPTAELLADLTRALDAAAGPA